MFYMSLYLYILRTDLDEPYYTRLHTFYIRRWGWTYMRFTHSRRNLAYV